MSQSTHSRGNAQSYTKDKHESQPWQSYSFMYYWIIFGIGCYFGQYLPFVLKTIIYSIICYFTSHFIY